MAITTTLEISFTRQNKTKCDKKSLNTVLIRKDDVDVLKLKTRCDFSNTKKSTALKFSPQLCGVTLILILIPG